MDKRNISLLRPELSSFLAQYITEERRRTIEHVLQYRSRRIVVALENIYQSQNASAVLRTCEGLGLQDIYIIERENCFQAHKGISLGAERWLSLRYLQRKQEQREESLHWTKALQKRQYRLIATGPQVSERRRQISLVRLGQELHKGAKIALLFGNEETGLSCEAMEQAEACLSLPMFGFTRSFNLSVSVGMLCAYLVQALRQSPEPWALSEEEKEELRLEFYRRSLRQHKKLEALFYKS